MIRPSIPRIAPFAAIAAAIILLAVNVPHAGALGYLDATPTGPPFPEWDGGNTGLCFADVNADGHVDLLSIGDHGSPNIGTDQHGIMVYFGDGNGGWSIHMEGNFGYGGVAVGDVNNDGFLDVGYGMHHDYSSTDFGDQLIEVALGDGSGTSWTPWDDGLATSGEDWGMFATDFADMDADGDLDLASNSFGAGNGVHVYRNNGDGTWTQTWALTGGNARARLCFGDVNGDGHPDIAASYQYGTIFLGDGQGGFSTGDDGLPGSGTIALDGVSLGDVDGDGCHDLSFTTGGDVFVYVWRTDHWEDSSAGLPSTGDYELTCLWDLDADGHTDLLAHGDGLVSVWLGDGSGGWAAGGGIDIGPAIDSAALAVGGDIDHNGRADVALVQEEGSWPSYQNVLYLLREDNVPTERSVRVHLPAGNETYLPGSAQTLRWSAAHVGLGTGTVTVELSLSGPAGPWTPLAEDIPDSGHLQWSVPAAATADARIRVSLVQGAGSASHVSEAFTIGAGAAATLEASIAAVPAGGTLPFSPQFTVTLANLSASPRLAAARIDATLAGGQQYPSWRAGWTTLTAGETYTTSWAQQFPAIGSLVGETVFTIHGEDVTPPPYNQPPYPPSGARDTAACTVTGLDPLPLLKNNSE